MLIAENYFDEMLNAISREIRGRVELYEGSTLLDTYTYDGALQSFVVERIGDSNKFFGYGVCAKCTVKLRDKERAINVKKGQGVEIVFGVAENYLYPCPIFFVDDVQRDENTNDLTIVAYDAIYQAANHKMSEVHLIEPYTIYQLTSACASVLGVPVNFVNFVDTVFNLIGGHANYEGTETLRDALDDIAEATQSIYYMDANWNLAFKRLDINSNPVVHLDKSKYFTLSTKEAHTLQNLWHVTELGDNVSASTGVAGETQYIRDNPLWELRDNVGELVENALSKVAGLTLVPFDLKWRGNFLLEIGDQISMTTKDNSVVHTYLINDTITYNGGLVGNTRLEYVNNDSESESTPSTLYDAVKMTYAKVDKANAQIDLVASTTEENTKQIANLQLTSGSIAASVEKTNTVVNNSIDNLNKEIDALTNKVNAQITSEDVQIQITESMNNGVFSITTTTGYTFNDEGLTISKSGSEMSTTVTEDGMSVKRNEVEMLRADNTGCYGTNLHATTYLIVGGRSRFENYEENRTGCFWVGGDW